MNRRRAGLALLRKAPLIVGVKVLLTMFVVVYAASIVTNTTTYQASTGGAISFTDNLKAMDKGFSKATAGSTAAGISCGSPVTFGGSPGTANNAIAAGDVVFTVQVNSTAAATASACFTVNLLITGTGGSQQNITVYLATDPTPAGDEIIDCKFSIGTSLPTSPYSFKVTVQKV